MAVLSKYWPEINITLVDINEHKIELWNSADPKDFPVFEKGLSELVLRNRGKNLHFSSDIKSNINNADMIFISVNTPTKTSGFGAGYASDLKWVESSAREVASCAKGHTIVVEKSTVPVRTAELIKKILEAEEKVDINSNEKTFSIISSPEFLAEGTAISDLENPDRVLIGGDDQKALDILGKIYNKWIPEEKILFTNLWSSELSKLTANAFLAQRISSINSISALCEKTGAKILEVANAIGSDTRIGNKFLSAGPGFGGSCFQKDILNLVYISKFYGLKPVADYWEQVLILNNWQRQRISKIVLEKFFGTVTEKKIAILGFSFKSNTNDTRESSAIYISNDLIENGANLFIHDPKVSKYEIENSLNFLESNIKKRDGSWTYCENIFQAVSMADAIIILTEWNEYREIDWVKVSNLMRKPAWVFDTRAISDGEVIKECGLSYWSIGVG